MNRPRHAPSEESKAPRRHRKSREFRYSREIPRPPLDRVFSGRAPNPELDERQRAIRRAMCGLGHIRTALSGEEGDGSYRILKKPTLEQLDRGDPDENLGVTDTLEDVLG